MEWLPSSSVDLAPGLVQPRKREVVRNKFLTRTVLNASQLSFSDRTTLTFYNWRFGLFSGRRIEIQTSTVEVDRMDEVLFIPESAGCVLDPLDLRIERFAGGIGN